MRILKLEDVLTNLVKKYNKGEWDEDLMQEAWVEAIKCEQANPNVGDENLKALVITWVKNRLINIKLKPYFDTCEFLDDKEYIDYQILLLELRDSLDERENKVLSMLLDGKTVIDIEKELKLSKATVYRIFDKIKRKIKS